MKTGFVNAVRRYLADESGISAGIVALSMVVLAGMGGLSIDLGYAYSTRVKLQGATNAAALAGAHFIGTGTDPAQVAKLYGAGSGNVNATGTLTTQVSATLLCLQTFASSVIPLPGTGSYPTTTKNATLCPIGTANAIQVVETGRSPTFFAGIFGFSYIPVTATATGLAHGGSGKPLDIAMILDTTESMSAADSTCGLTATSTKEQCAESGIEALLMNMTQSMAKVRLLTFPGFGSQTAGNVDWTCPKVNPVITPYWTDAGPTAGVGVGTGAVGAQGVATGIVYTVTPAFEQDYQTTPITSPATPNPNADIVLAIGYSTSCATAEGEVARRSFSRRDGGGVGGLTTLSALSWPQPAPSPCRISPARRRRGQP